MDRKTKMFISYVTTMFGLTMILILYIIYKLTLITM